MHYGLRKKEKEARKSNEDYKKLLSEFAALEKAELAYVYKKISRAEIKNDAANN